jgi:hypothetical protein
MEVDKLTRNHNYLLLEDDGGDGGDGGYGGGYGSGYGMGAGVGIGDDLIYKTFIAGWVDLFKTAKGATKSLVTSAKEVIEISKEAIADTLIPGYKAKYEQIFDKYENKQQQINKEYESVYNSITRALASNDDFLVSAFMYDPSRFFNTALTNPSMFVTWFGAEQAPSALADLYSTITGGDIGKQIKSLFNTDKLKDEWDDFVKELMNTIGKDKTQNLLGITQSNEAVLGKKIPILLEQDDEKKQEDKKDSNLILKVLLSPQLLNKVLSSKTLKSLSNDSREAIEETLSEVINVINELKNVNNIDELERVTGEKLENVPDELDPNIEKLIIDQTINSVKSMYVKMLKSEADHLMKSLPKSHRLVQAYFKTINEIK